MLGMFYIFLNNFSSSFIYDGIFWTILYKKNDIHIRKNYEKEKKKKKGRREWRKKEKHYQYKAYMK